MTAMTYGDLTTYDALDTYAFETGSGSSGNDEPVPTGTCPWTSSSVSAIQGAINELKTSIETLQADVTEIKSKTNNLPTNPAAVGSAMTLTNAYDAAKTAAPTVEAIANQVWDRSSGSTRTLTGDVTLSSTTINSITSAGGLTTDQATQLAKIFALLANWSVSNNTLTATVGSTAYTFTLTKNNDGDITGVSPTST